MIPALNGKFRVGKLTLKIAPRQTVTGRRGPPAGNDWKQTDPQAWVVESNQIARTFAYVKTKEGEAPSAQYIEESRVIVGRRIALAGYRLAAVLDEILVRPPAPPRPR